jgi:hypothetical protein
MQCAHDLIGAVAAAVVDQQQLERLIEALQRGDDAAIEMGKNRLLVVDGRDDGERWRAPDRVRRTDA